MDPTLLSGLASAAGGIVEGVIQLIQGAQNPAQVLQQMQANLAAMQAALGPGGTLDQTIAANNAKLDAAIAAAAAEETTKP